MKHNHTNYLSTSFTARRVQRMESNQSMIRNSVYTVHRLAYLKCELWVHSLLDINNMGQHA